MDLLALDGAYFWKRDKLQSNPMECPLDINIQGMLINRYSAKRDGNKVKQDQYRRYFRSIEEDALKRVYFLLFY